MPKVNSNGVNLYYETAGEGFPLVLIGGFTCDHSIWDGLVSLYQSLSKSLLR